ncbi:alpha/beta hydrolase [Paenibacillus sp. HB172176]|uniref:alpha/beta hydrolase n=1 Tax=Paenibacillus sp. HB172176 TaxID=2493690 RepID=UPI00143B7D8D|nr:alpha/beta hydrolase [Paenibacillus sp. HB172176]
MNHRLGVKLEKAAQEFVEATAKPPYLHELGPEKGRAEVDKTQAGDVDKPDADIETKKVTGSPGGPLTVRIVRPKHASEQLPVILYTHGAGWVFGNAHTHDRLIRELAVRTGAVVVFPEYSLSPEAKYPVAIEEIYAVLKWISDKGSYYGLDSTRIAVAGDSVGGNMTAAITLMAKEREGPKITRQLLFYPVTNASFDTDSYHQFAEGYFLRRDAMKWFWNQYTSDEKERAEITASPLRATKNQLSGLPQAMVITAEADVLRDEGEAYAAKLQEAGVQVATARYNGIIHDFLMLNALKDTEAAKSALALASSWLKVGFHQKLEDIDIAAQG